MSVRIDGVEAASPAGRAGILAGDILLSINGHEIDDVLDFRFWQQNNRLLLRLEGADGKKRSVRIRKNEWDELGLLFDTYLIDRRHACKNRCVFCFVDQLPRGLRSSLYFKDDDTRLSFLFGNYVTLTNLTEHEVDRICRLHISPLNISVHTTNPALRVRMMGNPQAGAALSYLSRFARAGIALNAQLVLCPGLNDGPELERSLQDLSALMPALQSVALVPVGLTRFREKLTPLSPYTPQQAAEVIDTANMFGERFLAQYGRRLVYCADEFYLKAGRPLPPSAYYEDYAQLENGVGLMRNFEEGFQACLSQKDPAPPRRTLSLSIATGVAAAAFMEKQLRLMEQALPGLQGNVYAIRNDFFGPQITVAGLVTATDLLAQLRGKPLGEVLVLPEVMLRDEKDRFLDDRSLAEVSAELGVPIRLSPCDGEGFYDCIRSIYQAKKEA